MRFEFLQRVVENRNVRLRCGVASNTFLPHGMGKRNLRQIKKKGKKKREAIYPRHTRKRNPSDTVGTYFTFSPRRKILLLRNFHAREMKLARFARVRTHQPQTHHLHRDNRGSIRVKHSELSCSLAPQQHVHSSSRGIT